MVSISKMLTTALARHAKTKKKKEVSNEQEELESNLL
jgi:hypothetical protein